MKVAIPVRNGRISPVFDAACRLVVIEFRSGVPSSREEYAVSAPGGEARASLLQELGVTTLICGAISNHTARMVELHGIELVPWTAGEVEEVLAAYRAGSLYGEGFAMPGCGGMRGGRRGRGRGRMPDRAGGRQGKAGPGPRRGGGRRNRE